MIRYSILTFFKNLFKKKGIKKEIDMTNAEKFLQYVSTFPFQTDVQMYNHGKRFAIGYDDAVALLQADGWRTEQTEAELRWWNPIVADKNNPIKYSDFYQNKLGKDHIRHKSNRTIKGEDLGDE